MTKFIPLILLACATPGTYALPDHPGWVVQETAVPVHGAPDEPPGSCDQRAGIPPPGPPQAFCPWTDAATSCERKTVYLYWYARAGALEHELKHVEACGHP